MSADGTLAKCMRVEPGAWRSKTGRDGVPYYLHRLADSPRPAGEVSTRPARAGAKRAAPDTLDGGPGQDTCKGTGDDVTPPSNCEVIEP